MSRHYANRLRRGSLFVQVGAGVALIGFLGVITAVVLAGILLHHSAIEKQRSLLTGQIQALTDCSARVNVPRLAAKGKAGKALNRIVDASFAGTLERGIIVINGQRELRYASAFPAPLLKLLLAQLRRDFAAAAGPRGASTVHSFTASGDIVADIISSCAAVGKIGATQSAGILIAESESVAEARFHDAIGRVLISGIAAVILIVLAGIALARVITNPVKAVARAVQASASGEQDECVVPEGPAEARDVAMAFNSMVGEAARRQRVDHDLLANISHELAASLGLIQGYAEGLADGVIEGEQKRIDSLRAITGESERLKRLTGNLLDLALLETGEVNVHVEDVPVNELLINLATRFHAVADKHGVTLTVDVPPALPTVRVDGFRLEQVLVNLLSNALRHTPGGGTVTMSARPAANGVNLAVADTGVGIPAEELSRIWERFYQVDKARDRRRGGTGLGLGLAICQSTITLLGGRIDVESVVGAGTTFRIWLPLEAGTNR